MISVRDASFSLPWHCVNPHRAGLRHIRKGQQCVPTAPWLSPVGVGYHRLDVKNSIVGAVGARPLSIGTRRPLCTATPAARLPSSLTSAGDLWVLLRPEARLIAGCALATLVSVSAFVCVAPALGRVIDIISSPASNLSDVVFSVTTLGLVYACSNICLALQVALATTVGETLAARLRAQLFNSLLRKPATFHDNERVGNMTTWLGQDIEVLQATVARLLGNRGLRAVLVS